MKRSGLLVVIFGILIVGGLSTSVIENQVTLEGITQGNGPVTTKDTVSITADIDRVESPMGVFAVQVMEFQDNTIHAQIIDPADSVILSQRIDEQFFEQEFEIYESGQYTLVISSDIDEEIYVSGAIGSLPDADKKFILALISLGLIIAGMIGLVAGVVLEIRNKKRLV